MGCCLSRAKPKNQNQNQNQHNNHNSLKNDQPRLISSLLESNPINEESPPPPPMEEESVKEVLYETSISKPHQVPILIPETKTQMPIVQNPSEKIETKSPVEVVLEVVSQPSETITMNESFSTTTTATSATVTEKREGDDATSKQCSRESTTTANKWNRSPSRKHPHVTDGNVDGGSERRVKSPARRSEPSPEKKMKGGSRLVRGRESGAVANRKTNGVSAGVCRDSGGGSGRRSRSPSYSRTVGRSSRVGIGGAQKQAPAVENGVEKKSESEEVGEKNDIVLQGESIENPHVSMECFIFL